MDSILMDNNMEGIEDESADQLISSSYSATADTFGHPKVFPNVGDQFQAEVPPYIEKCDCLQVVNKTNNSEVMVTPPSHFSLGLPIPLMWVNSEVENINETVEFVNTDIEVWRAFCPLPDSLGESWTDIEHDSFLLGLYIFGKNLILVSRFVESKKMGDILSFYYGKFYRSTEYRRWSKYRKLKSRRCIHGKKIFTEWRQQELLSRLKSHVPEESQNMLLEVSKTFNEEEISFEEYVFTLKTIIGINVLVESIGIGKGKRDLTGNAMDPTKANHILSVHTEIPTGKACASLTSADIIKFLTGDFRLSKNKSSDLFWEAVWPRLLARGWHSEQPKYHGISSSKHSLVFLLPGVKKFSRKLVKGKHYFDSIRDILNEVASKPGLLELEIEAAKGNEHEEGHEEEYRCDPPIKQDTDDVLNKKRHCYLQPRNSSSNRDLMKFTIIDTSLVRGARRPKVRELRSLLVESTCVSIPSSLSHQTEKNTSEDSENEVEETNTSNPTVDMNDGGACADSSECVNTILNTNALDPTIVVENHESHCTSSHYGKQQRKNMQYQSKEKVKCGHSKNLAPVTKEQSMTRESSCNIENFASDRKLNENESHCRSNSLAFTVGPPQNLSPANSLAEGSPIGSNKGIVKENCLVREASPEKPQPRTMIDLNFPQVLPDFGFDEPFITDMVQNNVNLCANDKPSFPSETSEQPEPFKLLDNGASKEQQPVMNNRRQSTRNRPLTTKALEAIAFGFYSPKKRKGAEAPQNKSMSRSSQRIHGRAGVSANSNNEDGMDIEDTRIEES